MSKVEYLEEPSTETTALVVRDTFKPEHTAICISVIDYVITKLQYDKFKIKAQSTRESWNGDAEESISMTFSDGAKIDIGVTIPKAVKS